MEVLYELSRGYTWYKKEDEKLTFIFDKGKGMKKEVYKTEAVISILLAKYPECMMDGPADRLKILYLLYFCHGYSLLLRRKPLIDEIFLAYDYGVTLPSLQNRSLNIYAVRPTILMDDKDKQVIRMICENYGQLTGVELAHIAKSNNSPWYRAYSGRKQSRFGVIKSSDIRNWLKKEVMRFKEEMPNDTQATSE